MRWAEIALNYTGLLALCLAIPKHYRQIWSSAPAQGQQSLLRAFGWCALFLSFAASVWVNGWSFGPVEWAGMLAMIGVALTVLFAYSPRLAAWLGIVTLIITPACMLA